MYFKSFLIMIINCFLVLSLISFVKSDGIIGEEKKNELPNCDVKNPIPAQLNNPQGSLKMHEEDLIKSSTCIWMFNISKPVNDRSINFYIKNLKLEDTDTITISYDKEKLDNLTKSFKSNTILLTGIPNNIIVNITLNLTSSSKDRFFTVDYNSDGNIVNQITKINDENLLTINHIYRNLVINGLKINFQLGTMLKDYQLVLSVYDSTLNSSAKYFKFSDTKNDPANSGDLFAKENKITIEIDKFNLTAPHDQYLALHYTVYDKICTYYDNSYTTSEMTLPTSNVADSINCLVVLEPTKYKFNLIDYSKLNFINNVDTLTIRDGNRFSSPITTLINRNSLDTLKNNYLNLIQKATLHITYSCPSTKSDAVNPIAHSISITGINDGGVFNDSLKMNIDKITNAIYIIKGENQNIKKKAFMEVKGDQIADGSIEIYDNLDVNDNQPLFKVDRTQLIPNNIWSRNNILRVHLINVTKLNFNLGFSDEIFNSVADGEESVKILNGKHFGCNNQSTWLIPSSPNGFNKSVYILNIPFIILNSNEDCLMINIFKDKRITLMKLCGNNTEMVVDQSLPPIMLNSSYIYEIIYKRGKINCDTKYTILLQLSLLTNSLQNFGQFIKLEMNKNLQITPETYPNSYILHDGELTKSCQIDHVGCGFLITAESNKSVIGHVEFEDLDIAKNHSLSFQFNYDDPKSLYSNSKLPDDYLIEKREFISLDTPLYKEYIINEKIAGRGFKINIDTYDCGKTVKNNKTTGSLETEISINGTKCIYIIDNSEVESLKSKILNFTINFANNTNAKKGKLIIYDSPTFREKVELEINQSLIYNPASVNKTIIIYEKIDLKSPLLGLNLTWKLDDCVNNLYCDNGFRCVLPEWVCDGKNHCKDGLDQKNCNSTVCPTPQPSPKPYPERIGVNGWVITFIIIPIAMIIGALIARFGPLVVRRLRGGQYQEFSSLSDVN